MRAPHALVLLAALAALAAPSARADDAPTPGPVPPTTDGPRSPAAPKAPAPPKASAARLEGCAIAWATSWPDAREEAAERNVAIFLHSHSSSCPPCKTIHRAVFGDPAYVRWANEKTIHAISYWLDPKDELPEDDVERDRGGEKVAVLSRHPALTRAEAETFVNEVDKAVKFPTKTPWAGVISPDGTTILAEIKTGQAKDFRALYDAQQKKLGAQLPRATWSAIRKDLAASSDAEFDEKWAEAVRHAVAARDAAKDAPKPLAERVATRIEALEREGAKRLEAATALTDPVARARAIEAVHVAFEGLPCAERAAAAATSK